MARIRIGSVGYLNAAPLTSALDPSRYEVVADHPRGIAAALKAGEVDVALVPVAAALTDDAYRIVPGWCIGSEGPVHSVAIFAETDPSDWTEVVLDGQSRTSQTLARLLLTQGPLAAQVRADLVITEVAPGQAPSRISGTVAGLVIGDPARAMPASLQRFDLGALWTEWTGKPFVFAVWAAREALPPQVVADLRAAGQAGTDAIPRDHDGEARTYLTEHIRYPLDERALMGLRRYAALAHRAGLVGTEHVTLFGPPVSRRPRTGDLDQVLAQAAAGTAPSVDDAVRLLDDAHETDLGVAAQSVRARVRPLDAATYLVEHSVDATQVAAGGDVLAPALDGALVSEATSVRLHGLDRLEAGQRRDRIRTAAATGLQVAGVDLAAVTALAQLDGTPAATLLGQLAEDGLSALDWRVRDAGLDAAILRGVPLPLHAHVVVARGVTPVRLARVFARLARHAHEGLPLIGVTVHGLLPEGSLVEPGAPTTSTWLRAISVARLMLPTTVHLSASPATQGIDVCQTALFSGVDDLGAVGLGPAAPRGAGARFETPVDAAERAIRVAGLDPQRRDLAFAIVGGPLTQLRKVRPVGERASLLTNAPPAP